MIIFSVKKVSVASPSPKPKIRKAPNRSFNLMGIFLAASGRLLVKHFGAWWMLTFFQCWGSPISQTFIWLLNVIINNVWLCKIRSKMKHNLRQVKFKREFAVFLQGQIPISIHGYWVGCFETTFAFLLERFHHIIVTNCL